METYRVSCKKNTVKEKLSVRTTKENKLILVSNCAVCGKRIDVLLKIKKLLD